MIFKLHLKKIRRQFLSIDVIQNFHSVNSSFDESIMLVDNNDYNLSSNEEDHTTITVNQNKDPPPESQLEEGVPAY
jgi:hypothetical protein